MPINDFDGTTNHAIGKVFDNDGTANHQIGKVYDYNGAASSLAYSADEKLYSYGTQVVPWVGGGFSTTGKITWGASAVTLDVSCSYGSTQGRASIYTKNKINLTNYSKITFVVSGVNNESVGDTSVDYANCYLGVVSTANNVGSNIYSESGRVAYVDLNAPSITDTGIRTIEMDVSNISGSYYIGIGIMSYTTYSPHRYAYVHEVTIS